MSKTYEVFPSQNIPIRWGSVIDIAATCLNHRFDKEILSSSAVRIQRIVGEEKGQPLQAHDCLTKSESQNDIVHTDASGWLLVSWHRGDALDVEFWHEECRGNPRAAKMIDRIHKSMEIGYSWRITKYAAQSSLCAIFHGYLAIAMAALSQGFLYSDDGAWEYSCMPMGYDGFLETYLHLENMRDSALKAEVESWMHDVLGL